MKKCIVVVLMVIVVIGCIFVFIDISFLGKKEVVVVNVEIKFVGKESVIEK